MRITYRKRKNQIKARRPRKATDKAVENTESLLRTSGASLMYAGYPYDPYV
jgi:hypothetical protein